jgi:hypothetical protein
MKFPENTGGLSIGEGHGRIIFIIVRRNLLLAAPIDWSIRFGATPGFKQRIVGQL